MTELKPPDGLWERLANLDRRIVYLFILLMVTLPFFLTPVVKLQKNKWVTAAFDQVEQAAVTGKPILIGMDYDSSVLAELQPMAVAMLRHAFSRNIKVVGINFIPNGTSLAATTMDEIAKEYGKKYGEDYVFLGYLPQYSIVLINWGEDFRKSYKTDYRGTDVKQIPMLTNIQSYSDFQVVACLTGTRLANAYISFGVTKFGFNFIVGVTGVSATEYYTYLQSGQLKGLLAGMKAAAEYEQLLGKIGDGMRGMASQTWGHLTMITFIVIGNLVFFFRKKEGKNKEEKS